MGSTKNIKLKPGLGFKSLGLPGPLVSHFVTTKLALLLRLSLFVYKMEQKLRNVGLVDYMSVNKTIVMKGLADGKCLIHGSGCYCCFDVKPPIIGC